MKSRALPTGVHALSVHSCCIQRMRSYNHLTHICASLQHSPYITERSIRCNLRALIYVRVFDASSLDNGQPMNIVECKQGNRPRALMH